MLGEDVKSGKRQVRDPYPSLWRVGLLCSEKSRAYLRIFSRGMTKQTCVVEKLLISFVKGGIEVGEKAGRKTGCWENKMAKAQQNGKGLYW